MNQTLITDGVVREVVHYVNNNSHQLKVDMMMKILMF